MRHHFRARIKTATVLTSALLVAGPGLVMARQGQDAPAATKKGSPKDELVSGAIVKVEKVPGTDAKGSKKAGPARLRLSINTNVVWRDWARDQAKARDEGSPKADADRGAKSIATLGQPADENSIEVIEVVEATKIETRFRSPSDETTKGETSPEKIKSDEGTPAKVPAKGKAVKFRAEDLLPGLFVEAEAPKPGESEAATLTVIRPIEAPEATPPAKPSPK